MSRLRRMCDPRGSVRLSAGALLLTACLAGRPARAQEWTRFRGPNGSGISAATTVPVSFTAADYNWRVDLHGKGHSSPVIWGDRIFITSADESQRRLLCLSAKDGHELWMKNYPYTSYHEHEFNSFASGSPTLDADHVYLELPSPDSLKVIALTHEGKEVWSRDLGAINAQHGGAWTPLVVGNVVMVQNDDDGPAPFLLGLNRNTGADVWKRPRNRNPDGNSTTYATPLVYQPKGGAPQVIFVSTQQGFTSLDPATGKLNWELPGTFKARCVGSPIFANDLIYATCGTGGGEKQGVAIRPGAGSVPPKVEWRLPRGLSYVPTPIAVGDLLFIWGDAGIVTCVRAATGEQVWQERVGGSYFGSPVCVNGKLYVMNARGELVVILAADHFQQLAKVDLGEPTHATPAVSGGVMYLRTESHLISVGGKASK